MRFFKEENNKNIVQVGKFSNFKKLGKNDKHVVLRDKKNHFNLFSSAKVLVLNLKKINSETENDFEDKNKLK